MVGWGGGVGWPKILVSAPVPLELILTGIDWVGAGPWGFGVLGRGLTIWLPSMVDYRLPHVLPLGLHLKFLWWTSRGDHSETLSLFEFFVAPFLHVWGQGLTKLLRNEDIELISIEPLIKSPLTRC